MKVTKDHEYTHAFFYQYPSFQDSKNQEDACKYWDYLQAKELSYNVKYVSYIKVEIEHECQTITY